MTDTSDGIFQLSLGKCCAGRGGKTSTSLRKIPNRARIMASEASENAWNGPPQGITIPASQ